MFHLLQFTMKAAPSSLQDSIAAFNGGSGGGVSIVESLLWRIDWGVQIRGQQPRKKHVATVPKQPTICWRILFKHPEEFTLA